MPSARTNGNNVVTLTVIVGLVLFFLGMFASVKAFGTGGKKANVFKDIYFSIGSLRFTASYIISLATEEKKDVRDVFIETPLNNHSKNSNHKKERGMVLVNGEDGIMTNLAKCCHPILGDEIVGFITKGEGVTIHRKNCQNVKRF